MNRYQSLDDLLKHSTKMELVREIGELRSELEEARVDLHALDPDNHPSPIRPPEDQ